MVSDTMRVVGAAISSIDDRADHPRVARAVGVFEDQRVQAVLGAQNVSHSAVGRHHPDPADAPFPRRTALEQSVDVHRLVGPMKPTDAEMRDADPDAAAVIARCRDRHPTQCGAVQPNHGVDGTGARIPRPWTMR
jgi:hypothetical protein